MTGTVSPTTSPTIPEVGPTRSASSSSHDGGFSPPPRWEALHSLHAEKLERLARVRADEEERQQQREEVDALPVRPAPHMTAEELEKTFKRLFKEDIARREERRQAQKEKADKLFAEVSPGRPHANRGIPTSKPQEELLERVKGLMGWGEKSKADMEATRRRLEVQEASWLADIKIHKPKTGDSLEIGQRMHSRHEKKIGKLQEKRALKEKQEREDLLNISVHKPLLDEGVTYRDQARSVNRLYKEGMAKQMRHLERCKEREDDFDQKALLGVRELVTPVSTPRPRSLEPDRLYLDAHRRDQRRLAAQHRQARTELLEMEVNSIHFQAHRRQRLAAKGGSGTSPQGVFYGRREGVSGQFSPSPRNRRRIFYPNQHRNAVLDIPMDDQGQVLVDDENGSSEPESESSSACEVGAGVILGMDAEASGLMREGLIVMDHLRTDTGLETGAAADGDAAAGEASTSMHQRGDSRRRRRGAFVPGGEDESPPPPQVETPDPPTPSVGSLEWRRLRKVHGFDSRMRYKPSYARRSVSTEATSMAMRAIASSPPKSSARIGSIFSVRGGRVSVVSCSGRRGNSARKLGKTNSSDSLGSMDKTRDRNRTSSSVGKTSSTNSKVTARPGHRAIQKWLESEQSTAKAPRDASWLFDEMHIEPDGTLKKFQFICGIQDLDIPVAMEAAEDVFQYLDVNGRGRVDKRTFISRFNGFAKEAKAAPPPTLSGLLGTSMSLKALARQYKVEEEIKAEDKAAAQLAAEASRAEAAKAAQEPPIIQSPLMFGTNKNPFEVRYFGLFRDRLSFWRNKAELDAKKPHRWQVSLEEIQKVKIGNNHISLMHGPVGQGVKNLVTTVFWHVNAEDLKAWTEAFREVIRMPFSEEPMPEWAIRKLPKQNPTKKGGKVVRGHSAPRLTNPPEAAMEPTAAPALSDSKDYLKVPLPGENRPATPRKASILAGGQRRGSLLQFSNLNQAASNKGTPTAASIKNSPNQRPHSTSKLGRGLGAAYHSQSAVSLRSRSTTTRATPRAGSPVSVCSTLHERCRIEHIDGLFARLLMTATNSEALGMRQMQRYAWLLGFEGGDVEWLHAYRSLCIMHNFLTPKGKVCPTIDSEQFANMLNSRNSLGNRLTNEQLLQGLDFVGSRSELANCIFWVLDTWWDGYLGRAQLCRFATLVRLFPESQPQSDEQWRQLQWVLGGLWQPDGLSLDAFVVWVTSPGVRDFFTTRLLEEVLEELHARETLLKQLFAVLSEDVTLRPLTSAEVRRYAEHFYFTGTDSEWDSHFATLCSKQNWDPEGGVFFSQFATWVEDRNSQAYGSELDIVSFIHKLISASTEAGMYLMIHVAPTVTPPGPPPHPEEEAVPEPSSGPKAPSASPRQGAASGAAPISVLRRSSSVPSCIGRRKWNNMKGAATAEGTPAAPKTVNSGSTPEEAAAVATPKKVNLVERVSVKSFESTSTSEAKMQMVKSNMSTFAGRDMHRGVTNWFSGMQEQEQDGPDAMADRSEAAN